MIASSSDDDVIMFCFFAFSTVLRARFADGYLPTSSSRPGRMQNRDLGISEADRVLDRDFFCRLQNGTPLFSEEEFERTYRMPRVID